MDSKQHAELVGIMEPFGYDVVPKPGEGENLPSFDVVSEGAPIISPSNVWKAINQAAQEGRTSIRSNLVAAQPHILTFADRH